MALTYRDLEFVRGSANDLNSTLTNRRREAQQQRQSDEDMGLRRELLKRQIERDQMADTFATERNSILRGQGEDRAASATTKQGALDKEARMKRMEDSFNWIKDGVEKGVIPPENANKMLKDAISKADPESRAIMQESELGRMLLNGGDVFAGKPTKSNLPEEFSRDPGKAYVTSGGAYIPPDEANEPKVSRKVGQDGVVEEETVSGTGSSVDEYLRNKAAAEAAKNAAPAGQAATPKKGLLNRAHDFVFGESPQAPGPEPDRMELGDGIAIKFNPDAFGSEAEARNAGRKAGDIITIKGVGKVRLK